MAKNLDAAIIARRQKDIENFITKYQDELDDLVGQHAKNLAPIWQNISKSLDRKITALYDEALIAGDPKSQYLMNKAERLQQLQSQIEADLKTAEAQLQPYYTGALTHGFERSYYLHGFGLEQAARVGVTLPILNPMNVLGVIANPWLSDGANYSSRLRADTMLLADKMRKTVAQVTAQGLGVAEAARMLKNVAGEGYNNSVRLMRTELNRASSQGASFAYMQNADILDGKRYNATLDSRTAPKDASNDGRLYDLDYDTEANPGIPGQRIPNHPNCRCSWTPVLSSLGVSKAERIARKNDGPDTYGENYYTKARTYKEYAQERGLPDPDSRKDNLKSYLRPGETVADINKNVVRWKAKGGDISVPKPYWETVKAPSIPKAAPAVNVPNLTGWQPASTIKEASSWAMNNLGIDHVDYKGFHIDLANGVNKTLESLTKSYPEGLEGIKFIGTAQARNKAYVERRLVEYGFGDRKAWVADYMQKLIDGRLKYRPGAGPPTQTELDYFTEVAEKAFDDDYAFYKKRLMPSRIGGNNWAQAANQTWGEQAGICYNEKFAKDYESLAEGTKRSVTHQWHPEGTEDPTSILTHEYGHQVDYYLERTDPALRKWVIADYRNEVYKKYKGVKAVLSEYATENDKEFFAEAFAEYLHNPNPREVAAEVGRRLDEALKTIRGRKAKP